MKTKIFPIFLIFTFSIIFFVFYKGLQNTNIYTPEIKSEIKIPNFDAKDFFSKDKINSDQIFIGSDYYLLNIWASWCVPCKEEHKYLMDLSKKENIKIIGQNYKDNFENAKNFLINLDNPYDLIFLDNDGTIAIEWGAYGVPETFLIKNNLIIKKINFTHPYLNTENTLLQKDLHLIQGRKRTWFCGSYFGYGFHEDGLKSSIELINSFKI